ncbi:SDR family NAD(P)-dependent oxidoreductase [Cohnella endophytica]|uniref:SDR family NAD(P)-dependent oxidoreductase n=1 Tax=Cohnella endophytica TaxID=2419778 RepID=UPI0013145FB0|nr:SDR family oxidoreductase [Cohnella endophytica]
MEVADRIVLVTGSGNGIGRAIAIAFAKEGASVVITDIDEGAAEKVAREIESMGGKAKSIRTDVSSGADVERLFAVIHREYGKLDVLVNNVGTTIRKPTVSFTEEEWDFIYDTNVKSMFLCARAAGKLMLKRGGGSVVNISSILGTGGVSRRMPYASSKAAVDSFTQTLACEWALDGVRVNAVAPGYIRTEGLNQAFVAGILKEDDMVRRTPQARLGTPENIADAVLFLCSSKAEYITGTVLYVDGGYSAYQGPEQWPSFHHDPSVWSEV